jgi:hypothetical protein
MYPGVRVGVRSSLGTLQEQSTANGHDTQDEEQRKRDLLC